MKFKIYKCVVLIAITIFSCSSEPKQIIENNAVPATFQDIQLREKITKTKNDINGLLNKLNLDSNKLDQIVIGTLKNASFILDEGDKGQIFKSYFYLKGLQSGYDADFKEVNFVHGSENNGYNMITSEGIDKFSGNFVSMAVNVKFTSIKKDQRNSQRDVTLDDGTTLVCEGCRRGCSPRRRENGDGYCTDCEIPNSNCTKTETEG